MNSNSDNGKDLIHVFPELKNLAGKSMIYGVGSIVLKILNFILIPIYTRFMSPKDYGLLAITSSLLAVFVILYSLEMRGAINFFYSKFKKVETRNRNISSIWLVMISFALFMAILLDIFGNKFFSVVIKTIPYSPYIRLVIWTAFFMVIGQVPQVLFQVKETPIPFVVLILANSILTIGISVYLIVILRLGALGYLMGAFISANLMAIPYFIITLGMIRPSFRWSQLRPILIYSLPLVLHSLSAWLLEYSDRVIMEKIIPLSQIGIYSLGFQFGAIVNIYSAAVNTAWVPLIFRLESQDPDQSIQKISRLVTYLCASVIFVFILLILFVREINVIAAPPEYSSAFRIAYWVAAGQLFQGFYYIPVNFLFLRGKTKYIPLITIGSAATDVALNLVLLPRFGVIAAAWASCISKILMLTIALTISQRIYPMRYEVKRLVRLLILLVIIMTINLLIPEITLGLTLALKLVLVMATLYIGFLIIFNTAERMVIINYIKYIVLNHSSSVTI